jgi:hypothetical protein
MQSNPNTYNGPAVEFLDLEKSRLIRKREINARKELEWQGTKDVEQVAKYFLEYLWTSSASTMAKLKEERRVQRIKDWEDNEKKRVAEEETKRDRERTLQKQDEENDRAATLEW